MWLDVKTLGSYLRIKEKTIYYFVSNGSIPHYRIGKLIRFKQEEIDVWMESKKAESHKKHIEKVLKTVYTHSQGNQTTSNKKREVA